MSLCGANNNVTARRKGQHENENEWKEGDTERE